MGLLGGEDSAEQNQSRRMDNVPALISPSGFSPLKTPLEPREERARIGHVRYVWPRRDGTGSNTPSLGRVDYLAYGGCCFGVSRTKI